MVTIIRNYRCQKLKHYLYICKWGTILMNIKNINNILNHITSVKNGTDKKRGICFLIGAGADISSGGILFRELKIRFLKENGCIVPSNVSDKILDEQFEKQIDKMSQNGRCETLDKVMKRYKAPSEGYSLLVMLAELGYIDAVITTNFDYLLEQTQQSLNLSPFTIFTPGSAVPEEYYQRCSKTSPIYLKMHGDLSTRLVTHLTQNEIQNKQYGEKFIKLFKHIIHNDSLIIVGYGGYDSLITTIFKEINDINEVYWCNISEPNDDSDLVKLLEQKDLLYYVNTTFDNLFQELSKTLLKDAKMKNTSPVFLPTVVETKITNQLAAFNEKFEYRDKLIIRKDIQESLENFLATYDNKCIAIIGKYKYGKSCAVYTAMTTISDITFFPIMYNEKYNILENMAQVLGYDTEVPFPIMYSFLKWWNETKRQLVFIIDDYFNGNSFNKMSTDKVVDFFNFLYIVQEFKYIQFIICFQDNIYNQLKKENTFALFGNIISKQINIGEFSEDEVVNLLIKNKITNTNELVHQELLRIPYVWEIINKNQINLTQKPDFFVHYIDAIYDISINKYSFTKHALYTMLKKLAYKQFDESLNLNTSSQEYIFLHECNIINLEGNFIYPELAIYFCKEYILNSSSWELKISENIIPDLQKKSDFSEMQMNVYVSFLAEINDIDKFDFLLKQLDILIKNQKPTNFSKKLVIKVLEKCLKCHQKLFECYLKNIDINTYSLELQYYLFKVFAELAPQNLTIWNKCSKDYKLSYASFVLCNDILFDSIKEYSDQLQTNVRISDSFKDQNGLIKLCHILTYFGWDSVSTNEYIYLKQYIINKIFPVIQTNESAVNYAVDILIKCDYNIFFNAGSDFEEQFTRCINMPIQHYIEKVLSKKCLTANEYFEIVKLNTDINNSWLFIISNIIVVQSMKNEPDEMYNMFLHFWDKIQFDVQVQHLDFFLSSVFWSLYLVMPCDRERFIAVFEKVVEKYERILFMFPATERKSSLLKFSEEFDKVFEDGFNPIAFYFYTAPYKSRSSHSDWNNGKSDLKIYWDLTQCMQELGKYDDMLRIVHALGQMISIYPKEGYSALENLASFDQPIIKKGIIRIFKENYLRYSKLTKKELEKSLYRFDADDIDEIIYNSDFLLENRTMEQLHWGRLFYNLEQMVKIDVSEAFLSNILQTHSCVAFLRNFIKSFF